MLSLKDLEIKANEKEEENYKFRIFLKTHANDKELDEQFKVLHNKYFKNYDCSKCRNCCKVLGISMSENEFDKICKYYNWNKTEIRNKYLKEHYGEYIARPCPFLNADNSCRIKECLPKSCQDYPYTNKVERLYSLLTVVNNSKICPVVYKILEDLKEIYELKYRKRDKYGKISKKII